jgi:exopolysaccharide production protein ExoZ
MKNKILTLHYLRGLAALSVLLFHFSGRVPIMENLTFLNGFKLYGQKGVDVFFFISGFVIFKSLENGNKNFWLGRLKDYFQYTGFH